MSRARIGLAALLLASLPLAPAAAQTPVCQDDQTLDACFAARVNAAAQALRADLRPTRQALAEKTTGANVDDELAASAIRDFLPRFAGALLTPASTDDLPAVDLRFNTPLARGRRGAGLSGQGGVTIHRAELFSPLIDSIPEGLRSDARKRLDDELEDGDDFTAFVALNVESASLGRSFAPHADLLNGLATALVAPLGARFAASEDEQDSWLMSFTGGLRKPADLNPDHPECEFITPDTDRGLWPVRCLSPARRDTFETWLRAVALREAAAQVLAESRLRDAGYDRLASLVNNQPQVIVQGAYRSRVGVVGPNEWSGMLRWERGFANMNGLRRALRRDTAGREIRTGADSLTAFRGYLDRNARTLARGDRVFVEAEVRHRPRYRFALAEDSARIDLDAATGFGARVGYGAYVGSVNRQDGRDRIDLHVSYDWASDDDALRQSRWLAGAFYTVKIAGGASGVVGLAWSDRPEFVGGADRRLHANLGLTYKFNRAPD